MQLGVLRWCLGVCQLNFLLRAAHWAPVADLLAQADSVLFGTLENVRRVSLTPSQRSQASLPLSLGGLGIRCATSCGPAARLAALCSWLVKEGSGAPLPAGFASAEEAVLELCEDDDPLCKSWRERPDPRVPPREACSQKSWSAAIAKRSIRILCQSASGRDSVRLRFVCGGDILPWLAAPPSKALDTGCGPPAFRLLLKWHLGCPIMDTSFVGRRCGACHEPMDVFGDHAVSCSRGPRWLRHFTVQSFLYQCSLGRGVPCAMERSLVPGSLLRPADLFFPRWDGRHDLVVDLSIRHPCPPTLHPINPTAACALLTAGKAHKRSLYHDVCSSSGTTFAPVFLTTWGSLEAEACPFFRDFVKRLYGDEPDLERASLRLQFMQSLGIRLMRFVGGHLEECLAGCLDPDLPSCPIPRFPPVAAPDLGGPPDDVEMDGPATPRRPFAPSREGDAVLNSPPALGRGRARSSSPAVLRPKRDRSRPRFPSTPPRSHAALVSSQPSASSCVEPERVSSSFSTPTSPPRKSAALAHDGLLTRGPLFPTHPTSSPALPMLPGLLSFPQSHSLTPGPLPHLVANSVASPSPFPPISRGPHVLPLVPPHPGPPLHPPLGLPVPRCVSSTAAGPPPRLA